MGMASDVTTGDDVRFWAGAAYSDRATAPFNVTKGGILSATGAIISGNLTATTGTIGGFTVGSDYIRDAADSFGLASTVTGGDDVRFWAGATFANRATAPFMLTEAGALTSTSGTIGGFTIGASSFSAGSGGGQVNISTSGTTGIQLGSGGTNIVTTHMASDLFEIYEGGQVLGFLSTTGSAGSRCGFFELLDSGGTPTVIISGNGGNAVFGGTIKTAAAVTWDVGAANSVSPTSPNRTLTVIVGGSTYYIHAKTTND